MAGLRGLFLTRALPCRLLLASLLVAATAFPAVLPAAAVPREELCPDESEARRDGDQWTVCVGRSGKPPTGGPSGGPSGGGSTTPPAPCVPHYLDHDPFNGSGPGIPNPDPLGEWLFHVCPDGRTPDAGEWAFVRLKAVDRVVVVGPAQLAATAYEELRPPTPVIDYRPRYHPTGPETTLVGLRTWLWVPPEFLRPATRRADAGTIWAEVRAVASEVSFDPGDGSPPVRCPGGGLPYDPVRPLAQRALTCLHVYQRPSGPAGFPVRVTVTWAASWTASDGGTGVLPSLTTTTEMAIMVQQMEVVND